MLGEVTATGGAMLGEVTATGGAMLGEVTATGGATALTVHCAVSEIEQDAVTRDDPRNYWSFVVRNRTRNSDRKATSARTTARSTR